MRLYSCKKHISSIEELMSVVEEGQSLFEILKNTSSTHRKSLLIECLQRRAANKLIEPVELSNNYNLSEFELWLLLKKYRFKKPDDFSKSDQLKFNIRARYYNLRYVLIKLNHFDDDDLDEVMKYSREYVTSTLERKPSVWSIWNKIVLQVKKTIRKIKKPIV